MSTWLLNLFQTGNPGAPELQPGLMMVQQQRLLSKVDQIELWIHSGFLTLFIVTNLNENIYLTQRVVGRGVSYFIIYIVIFFKKTIWFLF